jgi:hypothetical protein
MTLLEEFLADLSARRFLKEFSFRQTTFRQPGIGTKEVADNVVWIDDLLFLFQLKDRHAGPGNLASWLQKKVLGKATKQIRATLALASSPTPVPIQNDRGHTFDFRRARGAHAFKLILFRLPATSIQVPGPRFHLSSSVGLIHILNWIDYLELVNYLVTPIELADYLAFRESLVSNRAPSNLPSEGALLGQYLLDKQTAEPNERYAGALFSLLDMTAQFDLTPLLDGFAQRIEYSTGGPTSYYRILAECSKLSRTELYALKQRLQLAVEAAREDRFVPPYRFTAPRTDCGFLVLPLTRNLLQQRLVGLGNLTRAAKYDQHTSRQVGISIVADGGDLLIDWAYLEEPWALNEELERRLAENPPFRSLRSAQIPRYLFSTDRLGQHDLRN